MICVKDVCSQLKLVSIVCFGWAVGPHQGGIYP
jgi:hypothetical protein